MTTFLLRNRKHQSLPCDTSDKDGNNVFHSMYQKAWINMLLLLDYYTLRIFLFYNLRRAQTNITNYN